MKDILALLKSEIVTQRSRRSLFGSAETSTLMANDRFDRRKELCRRHDGYRHARTLEHRLDHLAVRVVRNDASVLDGVATHDAAGRNLQAEDRVVRGRELVHHLAGCGTAIEDAFVAFFEDHDGAALDALVSRCN